MILQKRFNSKMEKICVNRFTFSFSQSSSASQSEAFLFLGLIQQSKFTDSSQNVPQNVQVVYKCYKYFIVIYKLSLQITSVVVFL